jgi:hypothetical protein
MMSAPLGRHAQEILNAASQVLFSLGDSTAVDRAVSEAQDW